MRCVKCGEVRSVVLETRERLDGAMLQRRRECYNGHRFSTYEVTERLAKTLRKHVEPSAKAVAKRAEIWARHKAVVRSVTVDKMKVKDAAALHGLAANTVSWIMKQHVPGFDGRRTP